MILGILEPKQPATKIEEFVHKIGFPNFAHGASVNNHIWLFWTTHVHIDFVDVQEQQLTIDLGGSQNCRFTIVYAKCSRAEREALWIQLWEYSMEMHWIVGGDFNTILSDTEKRGGLALDYGSIHDFKECLVGANLSGIRYEGSNFTWCNNQRGGRRIWQRLDRFLCNGAAMAQFPELVVNHLPRIISDHAPILVSLARPVKYRPRFIFQRMWLDHPNFLSVVAQVWGEKVQGSCSFRVEEKPRRLKSKLKCWNWQVFGHIRNKLEQLKQLQTDLETRLQIHWNYREDEALHNCNSEMRQILAWETEILYQKTRAKWIQEGDRNTKFFHALVRDRRSKNIISLHQPNGEIINEPVQICDIAAGYYERLFEASPYRIHEDLFHNYQAKVTYDMNIELCATPLKQEIWETINKLSADSASGMDGFTSHFFRGCWGIVQDDIVDMVQGFFLGDYLHHHVTVTSLTLIPKVTRPCKIEDYRPISLSNFSSKVISKIIASRLAKVLPYIIDDQQSGFVQGRSIHESIALAQEIVADLDRKTEGGNVIFKYDMTKAYDRVEWRFLLKAMRAMGFSANFQDLVYRNICNIRYKVCVNGFYSREFRSSRGVR